MRQILRFSFIALAILPLWACARSSEFVGQPQQGAINTQTYPSFNVRPQAATEQFSPTDSQHLIDQLHEEGRRLAPAAGDLASAKKMTPQAKEDARREVEKTLKEIEQSETK